MVDHSHLSAGNTESSASRDLYAEFGVSRPNSPAMVDSEPVPQQFSFDSEGSASTDAPLDDLHPPHQQLAQEVFLAASHLTQKDRTEAVEERRKNLELMNFIAAHGFSVKNLNEFVQYGTLARKPDCPGDARQLVDKSPQCTLSPAAPGPSVPPAHPLGEPSPLLNPSLSTAGTPANEVPPSLVTTPPPSWKNVVLQSTLQNKVVLDYCPPASSSETGGQVIVRPPRDILLEGNNRWNSCLVGGFLHSRPPFKLVSESAHKLWGKYGLEKVFMQNKDQFVFKFAHPENRDNVLALGPWYITNKMLLLHHWREGIDFKTESCSKVPVWVKLHSVPLSYWSPKGLSHLASAIGKPLLVDEFTGKMEPMSYARICVEITSSSSLPAELEVIVFDEQTDTELTKTVTVEYQSKSQLCQHCHSFGHTTLKCVTPPTNGSLRPELRNLSSLLARPSLRLLHLL